jgi:hypothetical protein
MFDQNQSAKAQPVTPLKKLNTQTSYAISILSPDLIRVDVYEDDALGYIPMLLTAAQCKQFAKDPGMAAEHGGKV